MPPLHLDWALSDPNNKPLRAGACPLPDCEFCFSDVMNQADLFKEIIATYSKHGWRLERVLVRREISAEVRAQIKASGESLRIEEAPVDAMWFARTSHG